jgi:ribosomal protein S3AE
LPWRVRDMKDSLKRFNIKLFMLNDKLLGPLGLTAFVGESLTTDCAKHLRRDQTKSDFYNSRQC